MHRVLRIVAQRHGPGRAAFRAVHGERSRTFLDLNDFESAACAERTIKRSDASRGSQWGRHLESSRVRLPRRPMSSATYPVIAAERECRPLFVLDRDDFEVGACGVRAVAFWYLMHQGSGVSVGCRKRIVRTRWKFSGRPRGSGDILMIERCASASYCADPLDLRSFASMISPVGN